MKTSIISIALISLAIIGCAKRPSAIVPADIPMGAYTNQSCQSLSRELTQEKKKLATLSKQQNDAASGDAFGVFMLGVPVSSAVGGDKEGDVAVAKGKVNAIELALKTKGCRI